MNDTTTDTTPVEDTVDAEGTHESDTPADEATPDEGGTTADTPDADASDEADVFPRQVVEDLRRENAKYRQRAQAADTLAQRLHTELVRATGRLADPSDLPYAEEHLDDPDALAAAIEDLLERKPHLASRRPSGDIGQGVRGTASQSFSLLDMLKQHA